MTFIETAIFVFKVICAMTLYLGNFLCCIISFFAIFVLEKWWQKLIAIPILFILITCLVFLLSNDQKMQKWVNDPSLFKSKIIQLEK